MFRPDPVRPFLKSGAGIFRKLDPDLIKNNRIRILQTNNRIRIRKPWSRQWGCNIEHFCKLLGGPPSMSQCMIANIYQISWRNTQEWRIWIEIARLWIRIRTSKKKKQSWSDQNTQVWIRKPVFLVLRSRSHLFLRIRIQDFLSWNCNVHFLIYGTRIYLQALNWDTEGQISAG